MAAFKVINIGELVSEPTSAKRMYALPTGDQLLDRLYLISSYQTQVHLDADDTLGLLKVYSVNPRDASGMWINLIGLACQDNAIPIYGLHLSATDEEARRNEMTERRRIKSGALNTIEAKPGLEEAVSLISDSFDRTGLVWDYRTICAALALHPDHSSAVPEAILKAWQSVAENGSDQRSNALDIERALRSGDFTTQWKYEQVHPTQTLELDVAEGSSPYEVLAALERRTLEPMSIIDGLQVIQFLFMFDDKRYLANLRVSNSQCQGIDPRLDGIYVIGKKNGEWKYDLQAFQNMSGNLNRRPWLLTPTEEIYTALGNPEPGAARIEAISRFIDKMQGIIYTELSMPDFAIFFLEMAHKFWVPEKSTD